MEQHDEIGFRRDLVLYRIESSKEDLVSSNILFDAKVYKAANNRAYYSIFHAINAVHATDGKSYKRHKDAIANFNKEYVKTEIFPRKLGHQIAEAEIIRHASDFYYLGTDHGNKQFQIGAQTSCLCGFSVIRSIECMGTNFSG